MYYASPFPSIRRNGNDSMILQEMVKGGVLKPGSNIPKWLPDNCHYLTIMGSLAYGVSKDDSDFDVYGFCMQPVEMMFPHLTGSIPGFGPKPPSFDQWQQHHLPFHKGGYLRNYDFSIYSIIKFFQLCAENNPNMIDALFTPRNCIIHTSLVGERVRQERKNFLHQGAIHKFKGYAYAQMHKIKTKTNPENASRKADVEEHGYDLKFAYHVVRLANECQQILETGDLDLQRDNEILKSIRRGEWTLERLEAWFAEAEKRLDALTVDCKLPKTPDWEYLRKLLLECIECHYGTITKAVANNKDILEDIKDVVRRYERA